MEVTQFQERHPGTFGVIKDCLQAVPKNKWRIFNDQTAFLDSKRDKPSVVHVALGCSSDVGALTAPLFLKYFQDLDHALCFFGRTVGSR